MRLIAPRLSVLDIQQDGELDGTDVARRDGQVSGHDPTSDFDNIALMCKVIAVLLLMLPGASAQILPVPVPYISSFPPQLKSFFDLTDAQVQAITKANSDLNVFRGSKLQRQIQVQVELEQEMTKQAPDPMALGLRHVELEAIRRELQAEQQKTVNAVQNVLTASQKAKLATLQQALQLYSTACSAVDQNVLTPLPVPGIILPTNRIDPAQGSPLFPVEAYLLPGRLTLNPACAGVAGAIGVIGMPFPTIQNSTETHP